VRKAVIFDLGNVIFRVSFARAFERWARDLGRDPREVERAFAFDEEYCRFEKGLVTPAEYEAHVAGLLGAAVRTGEFAAGWNSVFSGLVPGVAELAARLSRAYRLVVLTNTNALHHPVWRELFAPVAPYFEKVFCSFQMGTRKPEAAAYATVLEYLGLGPADAALLDDEPENVRAAAELGLAAVLVSPGAGLAAALETIGVTA
jgi:HAD superfamily hydrolase (TIGR01509 family)